MRQEDALHPRILRERVGDPRGRELRPPRFLDRPNREPVDLRQTPPPIGEEAGERDEHLVAGREAVLDGGLQTAGTRGRQEQDVGAIRAVQLFQTGRDLGHELPEARPTVVHERAALGEQDLRWNRGRPGRQDDLRPVHDASPRRIAASPPGYQRRLGRLEAKRMAEVLVCHPERSPVHDLVLEAAAAQPCPERRPQPLLAPADRPDHRLAACFRDPALEVQVSDDVRHGRTDVHLTPPP